MELKVIYMTGDKWAAFSCPSEAIHVIVDTHLAGAAPASQVALSVLTKTNPSYLLSLASLNTASSPERAETLLKAVVRLSAVKVETVVFVLDEWTLAIRQSKLSLYQKKFGQGQVV